MPLRVICTVLLVFSSLSCRGPRTLEPIEPPPRPPMAARPAAAGGSGPTGSPGTSSLSASDRVASPEARAALGELKGRSFLDQDGVLGGGEWTVAAFSVSPYPSETWKKGPHISLTQGGTSRDLPIEADGDAADLYRRVTGEPHPSLGREMSDVYKAAIEKTDG